MINLTVRSKPKIVKELDDLATLKGLDRAQILRKIIEKGLEKEKILAAIELYQEGNSIELAAELAHVNLWDLMEHIHKLNITMRFNLEEEKVLLAQSLEKSYPDLSKKILNM